MTEENYQLATEIKKQLSECEMWEHIMSSSRNRVQSFPKKYLRRIGKKENNEYVVIGLSCSEYPLKGYQMPKFMKEELLKILVEKQRILKEELQKL